MFNNNTTQNVVKPQFKIVLQNLGITRKQSVGNLIIIFDIIFPDCMELSQIEVLNTIL